MIKKQLNEIILAVDDTVFILELIKKTLGQNFQIITAKSGEKALELAASDPKPDLILLDLIMPGMDGYKTLKKLRENPVTREIPVIFISAAGKDKNEKKGLELGAVDFISKPFNPLILKARVAAHLELKQHREKLETLVLKRNHQLVEANQRLQMEIEERKHSKAINEALFSISNAVNTTFDLDELYLSIHRSLGKVLDVSNFFIAIFNREKDLVEFPYYIDQTGDTYQEIKNISESSALTAEVLKAGHALMFTNKEIHARAKRIGKQVMGNPASQWVGVPLKVKGRVIGAMAVQSYESPEHFSTMDINILHSVSGQVAVAIERKRSAEALKQSEERFRLAMDATSNGIWDWRIGSGKIWVDPRYYKMAGYRENEFPNVFKEWIKRVHPDDFKKISLGVKKHIAGETNEINQEFRFKAKKGDWIWSLVKGRVVETDDTGKPLRILGSYADISKRKFAEEALKDSEERYKSLSDVTLEGIVFHDNGVVVDMNNTFAKMVGYTPNELIGKNSVNMFIQNDYRKLVYENIRTGYEKAYQVIAKRRDGSVFPVELEARESIYKGKALRVASVRDISEQKQTEEKLIQLQKMEAVGTLAGGIAHDFNNLLGGILGNIGLLQMYVPKENPAYKKIETMEKIVQRGAKLAMQLLGYARGGKYEIKILNTNMLIKDTLEMFGRTNKQIEIHMNLQNDLWPVEGDLTQIEQVLLNIFINASDSMTDGGELYINTENIVLSKLDAKKHMGKPGKYIMISIRDTGIGMDKQTKGKIFDPFFTTKERGKGTGLGLASAYGIVKNHSGNIDVYSELDKGSIFKIYLPASCEQLHEEVDIEKTIIRGSATILLVDDEYEFRDVGEEMLKAMGYEVLTAKNGKIALEIFMEKSKEIDLVIMDMIMPVMGGGRAFDNLKKIDKKIKVLLSSGYSQDSQVAEIMARGCDGFIQKPFRLTELSEKVSEILNK